MLLLEINLLFEFDLSPLLLHFDYLHLCKLLVLIGTTILMVIHALVVRVVSLAIVVASCHTGQRSDTDVFVEELVSGEVIHEVLCSDVTSLVFTFFRDDLFQLLADSLADLFEQESQRLVVLVSADILTELLVNLLDYLGAPTLHLVLY